MADSVQRAAAELRKKGFASETGGLLPDNDSGGGWLPLSSYEMPDPNQTPMEIPSEGIAKGLGVAFNNPGAGLGERASGLMDAAMNTLGIPQEVLTRVLSLNTYSLPSQVPFIQSVASFGGMLPKPMSNFIANFALDPLNVIAGVSSRVLGLKGAEAARGFDSADKVLNLLRYSAEAGGDRLFFESLTDAQKLRSKAGVTFPIRAVPEHGLYTLDLLDTEHTLNPQMQRQKLLDALKGYNQETLDMDILNLKYNSLLDKDASTRELAQVENELKTAKDPKRVEALNKQKSMITQFLASGAETRNKYVAGKKLNFFTRYGIDLYKHSDFTKLFVQAQNDALTAKSIWIKDYHQGWDDVMRVSGNRDPLSRAVKYHLANQEEKLLKLDPEAQKAIDRIGADTFEQKVNSLRSIILDRVSEVPDFEFGEKRKAADVLSEINRTGKTRLPQEVVDVMLRGEALTPQNADLYDAATTLGFRLSHSLFTKQAAKTLDHVLTENKKLGVWKDNPMELEILQSILNTMKGAGWKFDRQIAAAIVDNKQVLRQLGYLSRDKTLMTEIAQGNISREKVKPNFVSSAFESLIKQAEAKEGLGKKFSAQARGTVYKALLGGALDSMMRNFTGIINPMIEHGLVNTAYGMGATIDEGVRDLVSRKWEGRLTKLNIVNATNSIMSEILSDMRHERGLGKSLMQGLMAPMNISEYVNRGTSFYSALRHYSNDANAFADALRNLKVPDELVEQILRSPNGPVRSKYMIQAATESTRKLQFSYASTDLPPDLNNPITKLFFQFHTYPLRQTQLLLDWAQEGVGLQSKIVRHMALTGGIVMHGHRHGVDMSRVFGPGFSTTEYPRGVAFHMGYLSDTFDPEGVTMPAVGRALESSAASAGRLFKWLTTGEFASPTETPDRGWKDFLGTIRMLVPGGRYSAKLVKNLIEGTHLYDNPNMPSWIRDLMGVDPDPGVNAQDRLIRLLGFSTTRDNDRKEAREFLSGFIKNYRAATDELNTTVLRGGDVNKVRDKWVKRVSRIWGRKFEELGVPAYVLYDEIQPSSSSYLKAKLAGMDDDSVEQLLSSYPKNIKALIRLGRE